MTGKNGLVPWKLYSLIFAIGLLITGSIGYSVYRVSKMVNRFSGQIAACDDLTLHISSARFALGEYPHHRGFRYIERFDNHIIEANHTIDHLISGKIEDTCLIEPLVSPDLHALASGINSDLSRLRRLTLELVSDRTNTPAGAIDDSGYVAVFDQLIGKVRKLGLGMRQSQAAELRQFQIAHSALAVGCLALCLLVLTALRRCERQHSQAHVELKALNERLSDDIQRREMAEERLKMTQFALDHGAESVFWVDPTGQIIYANQAACRMTGYGVDELLDMRIPQIDPSMTGDQFAQVWHKLKEVGAIVVPTTLLTKSGSLRPVEVSAHLFEYDNREYSVSTVRDVSEREILIQELKTSRQQYQEVVDRVDVGVGLVDAEERFIFANAVAEDIYGVPRGTLVGRSLSEFVDPEEFAKFRRKTQRRIQSESENYEAEIIRFDGKRRTIHVAASPRFSEDGLFEGTFGLFRDVTDELRLAEERKDMEDRLKRAERMESIGLMAGGVAHDLNNMFSPIIGYPELILGVLPPDSKAIKWVKQMATAAESAADVIADLLTLARRGRYQMKPTGVNEVLKEYVDSPAHARVIERNPGIAFTLNLDPSVGHITGSATHLTKTFMNIITNAFEASSAGGSVSVTSHQQYLNRLPSGHDDVIAGEYVVVRVIDTGTGIPQEDIAKVFEPYFSRKKMGASGSGLGLSVVYGVVKDHHGYYDIQSEVGKGTEFALYFPVMSETADDDTFTATSEIRSVSAPRA